MGKFIRIQPALGWFMLVSVIINLVTAVDFEALARDDETDSLIEVDVEYELPMEGPRFRRGASRYLGPAGYYPCAAPDGYRGTCKPRATCASYYSTNARYDSKKPDKYKSCTYGYGYHGVCCPDVVYSAKKPNVIKVPPHKRPGYYDGKKYDVPVEGLKHCIDYASVEIKKGFENDTDLGRGEEDDSYWGNGVVLELYMEELHKMGWSAFFIVLITTCLKDKYGYNPAAAYDGGLKLTKYMNLLPPDVQTVCAGFNYPKCPKTKYRTIDGSCNNVKYPYWGAARTAISRLGVPIYSDKIWGIKRAKDGSLLPLPRQFRAHALPDKDVADPDVNQLHTYFGQTIVHDNSQVYFYQAHDGAFIDCCFGYRGRPHQVSPKCYAVELPRNDQFYSTVQQTCLNLARLALAPHYECAAGYGAQANRQTALLDLSLVYGTNKNDSERLRNFQYGLLKMSKIGDQYMLPIDPKAECFNTSSICFSSGDLRTTLHPGMTLIQTVLQRFHNYCAKKIHYLNPHWNDEKIFQECRRINIAVYQHITYNEYLPLLLGWNMLYDHGILPVTEGYTYDYSEYTNPATLAEWTGAAMRFHTSVYGHINMVDESYKVVGTEMLANTYNNPTLYNDPAHFDQLARGYIYTPQRAVDKYYDHQISLFMMRDQRKFGLDIGAINLERGRDYSLRSYNDYREMCGLKRAYSFDDFKDWIPSEDVETLRRYYKHPDDVELYAAGILERHKQDSILGPTWGCIVAQQFKNWWVGDRYFYSHGGPYAFTLPQLDQIRQMSMAALFCSVTDVKYVPAFAFRTVSDSNPLIHCNDYEAIPRIDFSAWKSKPKSYKRATMKHEL